MKSIKLESFVKMVVEDRDVGLGLSDEVGGDVCVEESGR